MRARKQLEKKKPSRRKTEQYWTEGQFQSLIKAGPANLVSRSMIPYQVLIYLLRKSGTLAEVRTFLSKRFNTSERLKHFEEQLDHMISNLAAFGFLERGEDGQKVTLRDTIDGLIDFRSVDPLYGAFCCKHLAQGNLIEKLQALESMLPVPPVMERLVRLPDDLPPGPLQINVVEPRLIQLGIALVGEEGGIVEAEEEELEDYWEEPEQKRPMRFPEMLKAWFDASLASPEDVLVRPIWIAGGIIEYANDFYKYVKSRDLVKNEGLILRHLLRLVILTGEFSARSGEDPEYQEIGEKVTQACRTVDPRYTDRFLESEAERRKVSPV